MYPRNSPALCTQGLTAMGPMYNSTGGYAFLNLQTEKNIPNACWAEYSMTQQVINQVEQLATSEHKLLTFRNIQQELIGNDPYWH